MIKDEEKYYDFSGDQPLPSGPSTWYITDWDQRRVISVTMDGLQDDSDMAIEHLGRHSSQLPRGIYRIYVSQTGEIISTHTDPKDDQTHCVHYPPLQVALFPEGTQTVQRDALEELDRLGPDVDLVTYPPCSGENGKKFAEKSWSEMNLWMRLPRHANIVSFDRVVVDELERRVIGFTTDYVPGGTLEENGSRVFQLAWLRQLIRVVDSLNLEYGIAHQDIAPRNLLVDEQTNSIMLFDFNFAARINHPPSEGERYQEERNDVKGVIFTVYEIITRDDSVRSVPHEEQDSNILTLEWVQHPEVKLDHPITKYKTMLHEWQEQRATNMGCVNSGKAPKAIDWPSRPRPPLKTINATDMQGRPVSFTDEEWFKRRQDVRERGGQALDWERPPQERLDGKTRMLSTGKPVTCRT